MNALRRRMDMTANNIANINTTGYREEKPLFEEYLSKGKQSNDTPVSFVSDVRSIRNTNNGSLQSTGHTFDMALQGAGFFSTKDANGNISYTRDGRFRTDETGKLVNNVGSAVLGDGGAEINIPTNAKDIVVKADGSVLADGSNIGKIQIAQFDNELLLNKLEDGRYTAPNGVITNGKQDNVQIFQGMLESSNVNPVIALTDMVDIARKYETAQKIISDEDERIRETVRKLSGNN